MNSVMKAQEEKEEKQKQKKEKDELDIVIKTFSHIQNFILQILLIPPAKEDVKKNKNKEDTSVWIPSYRRRHGSYDYRSDNHGYYHHHGSYNNYQGAYDFGKQVYNSIQNGINYALSPRAESLSTEAPESFSQFVGDENAVQVEVQTRSGDENVVKKLGLIGLKKLGDAFELIAEDKPIDIPPQSNAN